MSEQQTAIDDHDTPDPRPETLRRKTLTLRTKMKNKLARTKNVYYDSRLEVTGEWETYTHWTDELYGNLVDSVTEDVLAEIEQRAAARGYTDLWGWFNDGDDCASTSIADFIAEIRGELE
jgi:hypothetical protein